MTSEKDRIPTELEIEMYEQTMQAYSWSFQQDVVTFLRSLHVKGIDINWAIKCILIKQKTVIFDRKERAKAISEWERVARKCPDCGATMHLMRVNHTKGTMVGGGYQTQWICPNMPVPGQDLSKACGFSEMSKRSLADWFKKLRVSPDRLKKMKHPYLITPQTDFVAQMDDPEFNPDFNEEGDQNADQHTTDQ